MRVGLILALGLWLSSVCLGDQVTLRQGDRLHGKVLERSDSYLILDHPVLGRMELPWTQIQSFQVDSADASASQPATSPGDAFIHRPSPRISVQQEVPASQAVIEPSDLQDAQAMTPAQPADSFMDNWDAQLELSLSGSQGNTESTALRIGVNARKETLDDRWKFDSLYTFARDRDVDTSNRATVGVTKDWLLTDSPYFLYAQGRYDYDQFNTFRHRLSGSGGVGVNLLQEQELQVILRAGLGATKEFGSQEHAILPEGSFGGEINYFLSPTHRLSLSSTAIFDLLDLKHYRVRSQAAWTAKIDQVRGLSLRFSVENEYQSQVTDDAEPNDLRYFISLLFDF